MDVEAFLMGSSMEHAASQTESHMELKGSPRQWKESALLEKGTVLTVSSVPEGVLKARHKLGINPGGKFGLCEAVLAAHSPLVGKTREICDNDRLYGASIIAVRSAPMAMEKISTSTSKLANEIPNELDHRDPTLPSYVMEPGDTLLLEVMPKFSRMYSNSSHFLLIKPLKGLEEQKTQGSLPLSIFAGLVMVTMVTLTAANVINLLLAALLAAAALILAGTMTLDEAFAAVRMRVLIAVVCTFGLGNALENSGVANAIATQICNATASGGTYAVVAALFVVTTTLGSFINNNACVVLMWPIAKQTAATAGISMNMATMTLLFACSASFLTPMSYQTNLMVYEPGGYNFSDFPKLGLPLTLILVAVTVFLVPVFY